MSAHPVLYESRANLHPGLKDSKLSKQEMVHPNHGNVQSENGAHWFAVFRVERHFLETVFEVRFLSFGGCVRRINQSAVTCKHCPIIKLL